MKTRTLLKVTSLFTASVLIAGSLYAAPAGTDNRILEREASALLKDVRSSATDLTLQAAILDSYARGGITRHSHALRVGAVKSHINTIGRSLDRLQEIRDSVSPLQRQAIDLVVPVAVEIASHTEAAIAHLNASEKPLWGQDYVAHLRAIYEHSGQLRETVDVHLDMEQAGERLERVRDLTSEIN